MKKFITPRMIKDLDIILENEQLLKLLVPRYLGKTPLRLVLKDKMAELRTVGKNSKCIARVSDVADSTLDLLSKTKTIGLIESPDSVDPSLNVSKTVDIEDERSLPAQKKGRLAALGSVLSDKMKAGHAIIAPLSEKEHDPVAGEKRRKAFSIAFNVAKGMGTMMAVKSVIGFTAGPVGLAGYAAYRVGRNIHSAYKKHKEAEVNGEERPPFFSVQNLKRGMRETGRGLKNSWSALRSGEKGKWGKAFAHALPALGVAGTFLTVLGVDSDALADTFNGVAEQGFDLVQAPVTSEPIFENNLFVPEASPIIEQDLDPCMPEDMADVVPDVSPQQAVLSYSDTIRTDMSEEARYALYLAERGHVNGFVELGWHYFHGEGVPVDPENIERAKQAYQVAVDMGHEKAAESLSWIRSMYPDPDPVPEFTPDMRCGEYSSVFEEGPHDIAGASVMDENSTIIEEDLPPETPLEYAQRNSDELEGLAKEALSRAQNGSSRALADLGYHYFNGDGAPKNIEMAKEFYRLAIDANVPGAQENLDYILRLHPDPVVVEAPIIPKPEEDVSDAISLVSESGPNSKEIAHCTVLSNVQGKEVVDCKVWDDTFDPGESITVSTEFDRVVLGLGDGDASENTADFLNKVGLRRALDYFHDRLQQVAGLQTPGPTRL